jgi:ABC-type transporter Mla subunit MlaD
MKQKETYFKVGLFVLLCAAGLVAGLLFVGADVLRGEVVRVETYIDESVQGLSVGSAVLHRGVNIGRVERITFVQAEYPMDPTSPEFKQFGRHVMVVMALDPRSFPGLDRDPAMITAMLRNQVALGLRFKLSYQGITGLSFVEADYVKPQLHPELQVPWVPKNIYISSSPSLFSSFTQALESVFQRLEKIPFQELVDQFNKTLVEIQTMVRDADVSTIRNTAISTMDSVQTMVRDADVAALRKSAMAMMDDFKATSEQFQRLIAETDQPIPGNLRTTLQDFSNTLARIDELLGGQEMNFDAVMANLKILSQNLRQISDSIKDNPASLFFAAPPAKSEVVQ